MFTGLVEEVGAVTAVCELGEAREITIAASPELLADLDAGDSIAVDGVCQTVVSVGAEGFTVQAIASTLSRTTFGEFEPKRPVNLERPLASGDRFGGHFVQGHVDGVGSVTRVAHEGEMVLVHFTLPAEVAPYTILHGSITLDGVSLTLNELPGDGTAGVALIPYTYAHTNLSRLARGSGVNLEADMLGKYAIRAMEAHTRKDQ